MSVSENILFPVVDSIKADILGDLLKRDSVLVLHNLVAIFNEAYPCKVVDFGSTGLLMESEKSPVEEMWEKHPAGMIASRSLRTERIARYTFWKKVTDGRDILVWQNGHDTDKWDVIHVGWAWRYDTSKNMYIWKPKSTRNLKELSNRLKEFLVGI